MPDEAPVTQAMREGGAAEAIVDVRSKRVAGEDKERAGNRALEEEVGSEPASLPHSSDSLLHRPARAHPAPNPTMQSTATRPRQRQRRIPSSSSSSSSPRPPSHLDNPLG